MKNRFLILILIFLLGHHANSQTNCVLDLAQCFNEAQYSLEENDCSWTYNSKEPSYLSSFLVKSNEELSFEFVLNPKNQKHDLDFVFYQIDGNNWIPLRTMLSGSEQGGLYNNECLGKTGLQRGFTEKFISAGCKGDNFLNPISLIPNELYLLVVFSKSDNASFTIESSSISRLSSEITLELENEEGSMVSNHSSYDDLLRTYDVISRNKIVDYPFNERKIDLLGNQYKLVINECETELRFSISDDDLISDIVLKPNPTATVSNLSFEYECCKNISIGIFNEAGQRIKKQSVYSDNTSYNTEIEINDFISGNYIVKILDDGQEIKTLYLVKI